MSKIQFRGKRAEDGKWVYGYYMFDLGEHCIMSPVDNDTDKKALHVGHEVDPETVGQFTGLTDGTKWDELTPQEQKRWTDSRKQSLEWSGRRVFEGDIVEIDRDIFAISHGQQPVRDVVEINPRTRTWLKHEESGYEGECFVEHFCTKVIGNIHDDPGLLESETEQ